MADTASYGAIAKSKLRPKRKRKSALPPGAKPVKFNPKVRGAETYSKGPGRPD